MNLPNVFSSSSKTHCGCLPLSDVLNFYIREVFNRKWWGLVSLNFYPDITLHLTSQHKGMYLIGGCGGLSGWSFCLKSWHVWHRICPSDKTYPVVQGIHRVFTTAPRASWQGLFKGDWKWYLEFIPMNYHCQSIRKAWISSLTGFEGGGILN